MKVWCLRLMYLFVQLGNTTMMHMWIKRMTSF